MASKGAKAALLDTSLKELDAAMTEIAELTGVPAVEIPKHNRDPEYLIAIQVEAMAKFVKQFVQRLRAFNALVTPENSAPAENSDETPPDGSEPVEGFQVGEDGVMTGQTEDGPVTSAGQETPESVAEPLTDEQAAVIPPAEVERQPAPKKKK